jgi:hypothetical protein
VIAMPDGLSIAIAAVEIEMSGELVLQVGKLKFARLNIDVA